MSDLKLVIFDCDGVLVDSESITNFIFIEILSTLGLTLTHRELVERYVGNGMSVVKDRLKKDHDFDLPDNFLSEFHQASLIALQENLKSINNIESAIDSLRVPYCLASNSSPDKVRLMLTKTGLINRFENQMYTSNLVAKPKPAPDIYLYAARSHGIEPNNTLVIEDTHIGVAAGVAAGMTVFGYTGTFPSGKLLGAGAHATFDNMLDLSGLVQMQFLRTGILN